MNRFTRFLLTLWCGLVLSGCSRLSIPWSTKDDSSPLAPTAAGPMQVKVDGYGRPVGESQIPVVRADDFLRNVEHLLAEQRTASARQYVAQRLDTAGEVLKQIDGATASQRAATTVAKAYDDLLGLPPRSGWVVLLSDRVSRPQAYAAYDALRKETLDKLRSGTAGRVDTKRLVAKASETPSSMLVLDAWQLHGVALLVTDQPGKAVEAFREGQRIAVPIDGQQAVQFGLLLSDAMRRAGDSNGADTMWEQTVAAAADLAGRSPSVIDPTFWDKAAYLRPFSKSWPPVVAVQLAKHAAYLGDDGMPVTNGLSPTGAPPEDPEAIVWSCVGQTLWERDDGQAALVAFKRAEAATRSQVKKDWLRQAQAKTLAQLSQPAAATALWVQLSSNPDPKLAKAAMASLGGMKLRQGDLSTGHRMLSKALEDKPPLDWPDRGAAEADFALAVLMRGDTSGGLNRMHIAQDRFQAEGNSMALANSVWNEAKFMEHAGRKAEATAAWTRWRELEQDNVTKVR